MTTKKTVLVRKTPDPIKLVRVSPDTHQKLKIKAAEEDKTIGKLLAEFVSKVK